MPSPISPSQKEPPITRRQLSTHTPTEQALLVAVEQPGRAWAATDSLEELARLAETVDVEVAGAVTQRLRRPISGTYVGKGKLQEIKERRDELEADVVLIDGDLTPAQQRNLEKELDVKVIDRTALILDVFARRAATHEGRLQVELAQLEYRLPRLTGLWTHLSRQGAGGVGLRGPGETQLESDRRELGKRIVQIKRDLGDVHRHRELYRQRRKDVPMPVVAFVGYTNAGKSTLLNAITGADVLAEDKLFATLDPTTRRTILPGGRQALLTDTVGFINNLPTLLVAAFRATLEEINEANVLLHVVDITHPNAAEQVKTVMEVLEELGADDKTVVTALNKVDRLLPEDEEPDWSQLPPLEELLARLGDAAPLATNPVPIAAAAHWGFERLLAAVEDALEQEDEFVRVRLTVPFSRSDLVERFYRTGRVESREDTEAGTVLVGRVPTAATGLFGDFLSKESAPPRRKPEPVLAADPAAPVNAA